MAQNEGTSHSVECLRLRVSSFELEFRGQKLDQTHSRNPAREANFGLAHPELRRGHPEVFHWQLTKLRNPAEKQPLAPEGRDRHHGAFGGSGEFAGNSGVYFKIAKKRAELVTLPVSGGIHDECPFFG